MSPIRAALKVKDARVCVSMCVKRSYLSAYILTLFTFVVTFANVKIDTLKTTLFKYVLFVLCMHAENNTCTTLDNLLTRAARVRPLRNGFPLQFKRPRNGGTPVAKYKDVVFYKRAAEAEQRHMSKHDSIVLDMEFVKFQARQARATSFGRVYAVCNRQELSSFMTRHHFSDWHMYESLGANQRAHKLVLDLDRDMHENETIQDIMRWNQSLRNAFIPMLCQFLRSALRCGEGENEAQAPASPDDILVLDASMPGVKYSKHLIWHVVACDERVVCAPNRSAEKHLMRLFKAHVDRLCTEGGVDDITDLLFDRAGKSVVDYTVYTVGKRSMRMAGSCKGNGKRRGVANRNLVTSGPSEIPWWTYSCNTWGMPSVLWSFAPHVPAAPPVSSGRRSVAGENVHTPAARVVQGADVPPPLARLIRRIAAEVHPHFTSMTVRAMAAESESTPALDVDFVSCNINYAPAPGCEQRVCAFGQQAHSRHYACVSIFPNGAVEYFCYGCQESVTLCDTIAVSSQEASSSVAILDNFVELSERALPHATVHTSDSRYLLDLPTDHNSEQKGTYAVKSAMGTGKTARIADFLSTLPPNATIMSIGFRQTLNTSLAKRFNLVDYKDARTGTCDNLHNESRVSIQLDSLMRMLEIDPSDPSCMRMRSKWNVVIIDEVESLLAHLLSDTLQRKVQHVWKLLEHIGHTADVVIMCDADMGANTLSFIDGLNRRQTPTHIIHNVHVVRQMHYVMMHNASAFTHRLLRVVRRGGNAFLATNSLKFALFVRERLHHMGVPADDILLIQGASGKNSKQAVSDCDIEWSTRRVVICTPAVAAGVDFSVRNHFDHIFVYGTALSNTARELNQQSGRVRHPVSDTVYVCIDAPRQLRGHANDNANDDDDANDDSDVDGRAEGIQRTLDLFNTRLHHTRQDLMSIAIAVDADDGQHERVCVQRVSACPPLLQKVLCQSLYEKQRSREQMATEYERIVRSQGGSVTKLPSRAPTHRSVALKCTCTFEAELDESRQIAGSPYVPNAHLDSTLGLGEYVQRQSELAAFYGGVAITEPHAVHTLRQRSFREVTERWCLAHTPTTSVVRREASDGVLMPGAFTDHGLRSHRHSGVIELATLPWAVPHYTPILMYLAGCPLVKTGQSLVLLCRPRSWRVPR